MNDQTNDLLQAILTATPERKADALKVLRGDSDATPTQPKPITPGPLLLAIGKAAEFIGVSRSTMGRMIRAGTIKKVEIMPGNYRVRRLDLEAMGMGTKW